MSIREELTLFSLFVALIVSCGTASAAQISDELRVTFRGGTPIVKTLTEEMEQQHDLTLAYIFDAPSRQYCIHLLLCGDVDSRLLKVKEVGTNTASDTIAAFIIPHGGLI